MKSEFKDILVIVCIISFGFGLLYFAKYHLKFDTIQLSPIIFVLALGILSLGGAIFSMILKYFELLKEKKGETDEKN